LFIKLKFQHLVFRIGKNLTTVLEVEVAAIETIHRNVYPC